MTIHKQHPDYLKFVKNERNTLNFLFNSAFINKTFSSLSGSAKMVYYTLPSKDKDLIKKSLLFGCNFEIEIEKKSRRIVVEAMVKPNFSQVSYILSICDDIVSKPTLMRKFHFDYAIPNPNEDDKPVYHFQYGGELSPELEKLEVSVDDIYPWLSSPRITYTPINLALLLDMIFCEFRTKETNDIVERSEWRDFIKNNEEMILKPYYDRLKTFIIQEHKSKYLFRDFYYGR